MGKYEIDPDYIEVNDRIKLFYERYPDGRIVSSDTPLVVEADGRYYIVVHARAYRTPDDLLPGDGWAWEPVPGTTPFTKNSELMNAQTAAIGRAIVGVGLLASRKIASAEEVRNRKAEQSNAGPVEVQDREHSALDTLSDEEVAKLEPQVREWLQRNKNKKPQFKNYLVTLGVVNMPDNAKLKFLLQQIPDAEKAAELLRWLGKNDGNKTLTGDELADELIKEGVAVEAA